MQRLTKDDFGAVFSLIEKSFPVDEYRVRKQQEALFSDDSYIVYGLKEADALKAFVSTWQFDDFVFIEHFAVNPLYRNNGLGAKILNALVQNLKKRVCLEVELPTTVMARRRIGFYERNGFFLNTYPYEQPPLSQGKKALPLYVMTSGGFVDEQQFSRMKNALLRKVYRKG